jgi:fimbrial chaperone protein
MRGDARDAAAGGVRLLVLTICLLAFSAPGASAGGFYVVPTSLELGKRAQSGLFTVVNSSDRKLDFKVSVQSWAQDAEGKDLYADTQEVVFFPRIMTVEPNDRRAIRVGVKGAPPAREKAYRIFVEEIPRPGEAAVARIQQGNVAASIAFSYRFSIPIFWVPTKVLTGGALEKVELRHGEARAVVVNTGTTRIKIPSMVFRGKGGDGRELFTKEVNGWYVLQGMSRSYTFRVPPEHCDALAAIEFEATTEKGKFDGILNVEKEMCTP